MDHLQSSAPVVDGFYSSAACVQITQREGCGGGRIHIRVGVACGDCQCNSGELTRWSFESNNAGLIWKAQLF